MRMMLSGSVWRLIVSTCAPSSGCQQQQKQPPRKVGSSPSSPPMILLSLSLSLSLPPRLPSAHLRSFSCFLLSVFHYVSLFRRVLCPTLFPEFSSPSLPRSLRRPLYEVMPLLFVWTWSWREQRWKVFDIKLWGGVRKRRKIKPRQLLVFGQFVPSRKLEDASEPSCFPTAEVSVCDRLFHILVLDAGRAVSDNPAGAHINEAAPPDFSFFTHHLARFESGYATLVSKHGWKRAQKWRTTLGFVCFSINDNKLRGNRALPRSVGAQKLWESSRPTTLSDFHLVFVGRTGCCSSFIYSSKQFNACSGFFGSMKWDLLWHVSVICRSAWLTSIGELGIKTNVTDGVQTDDI